MRALLLAGVVVFGGFGTALAAPITYNAVNDFSTASNPNGVWSYGYGTVSADSITFTPFTMANSAYGSPAWNLSSLPLVGSAYTGGTVAVPASDLWLHPGNSDNLAAILRFTAPFAGTYNLSALFQRGDVANGGGTGVVVAFYDENDQVTRDVLPTTYLASVQLNGTSVLEAGETLSFVVDRNGDYTYDSTGVQVVLTTNDSPAAVPEPASLALLGMGVAGIAAARRRRAI